MFSKKKYRCSIGRNGLSKNKKEGDLKTPVGTFKFLKCYYRSDRLKKPITPLKCYEISKKLGWCDDVRSEMYNKIIKLPSKLSHEKLFRRDNLYDLLVVLSYNINPAKKNLGSAIFLHIAKKNYEPTEGCIALKKRDIILLIKSISTKTKIKIG